MIESNPAPIAIGYKCCLRDEDSVMDYMSEAQPPGNYKKPESIAAWHADPKNAEAHKAKLLQLAPRCKVTGWLSEICAHDIRSGRSFYSADDEAPQQFVEWLFARYPTAWPSYAGASGHRGVCFYGFDPKTAVRLAGQNAIRLGTPVPAGLWYKNEEVLDPFEMLREAEAKQIDIPLTKLLVEAPGETAIEGAETFVPGRDSKDDCRIVLELGARYGLFPSADIEILQVAVDSDEHALPDEEPAAPAAPAQQAKAKPKTKQKRGQPVEATS